MKLFYLQSIKQWFRYYVSCLWIRLISYGWIIVFYLESVLGNHLLLFHWFLLPWLSLRFELIFWFNLRLDWSVLELLLLSTLSGFLLITSGLFLHLRGMCGLLLFKTDVFKCKVICILHLLLRFLLLRMCILLWLILNQRLLLILILLLLLLLSVLRHWPWLGLKSCCSYVTVW